MKILTIGGATQDIILEYGQASAITLQKNGSEAYLLLPHGAKINIDDITYGTGGGATNTAVSFARLGFDVATFCKVGTDCQGQLVLEDLEKAGIKTQHVVSGDEYYTGLSVIIPTADGDRTVLAFRGANKHLQQNEVPLKAIAEHDVLYVTSLGGDSASLLAPITQQAKKNGLLVANNPGSSQLQAGSHNLYESLQHIDILIMNSDEARSFMVMLLEQDSDARTQAQQSAEKTVAGRPRLLDELVSVKDICCSLRTFFDTIHKHGPRIAVVTDGREGVYASDGKQLLFHPSVPGTVRNTIGAGDAFGSAFVAMIAQKKEIADALRAGVINAASVISFVDTKQGLLEAKKLQERVSAVDRKLLQKF